MRRSEVPLRRIELAVVLIVACMFTSGGEAEPAGKVYRLGILMTTRVSAFEEELKKFGYIEGQNLLIERRYSHGRLETLDGFAHELVEFRPDVIAVTNGQMARAVLRATKTIPIVVVAAGDLEAQGLVASLAKPGGTVTGLQIMSKDLAGKRLELLHEIVPTLRRLAVITPFPGDSAQQHETELAAQKMGMRVEILRATDIDRLLSVFNALTRSHYDGLVVLSSPYMWEQRRAVALAASANRLPSIFEEREFVVVGGLASYGPSTAPLNRRAVVYVDKILKGAKPADLPVEQPTKFDLVINLKTAKALGLAIPRTLLLRADQVIE